MRADPLRVDELTPPLPGSAGGRRRLQQRPRQAKDRCPLSVTLLSFLQFGHGEGWKGKVGGPFLHSISSTVQVVPTHWEPMWTGSSQVSSNTRQGTLQQRHTKGGRSGARC